MQDLYQPYGSVKYCPTDSSWIVWVSVSRMGFGLRGFVFYGSGFKVDRV